MWEGTASSEAVTWQLRSASAGPWPALHPTHVCVLGGVGAAWVLEAAIALVAEGNDAGVTNVPSKGPHTFGSELPKGPEQTTRCRARLQTGPLNWT